jgi:hypothetical protein
LTPVTLPASAEIRLRRLNPEATYNPELHRLLLPIRLTGPGTDLAAGLVEFLQELLPTDTAPANVEVVSDAADRAGTGESELAAGTGVRAGSRARG